MTEVVRKYGWKPDVPDFRDKYLLLPSTSEALPTKVDFRNHFSFVFNQGDIGSCTANAIGQAFIFAQNATATKIKKLKPDFVPSRLFLYYNEREMEGTVDSDSGAYIRDGIKSINKQGICHEKYCVYNTLKFHKKPTSIAYKNALAHQALQYARVTQTEYSLKQCLASGLPFVFGFTVYGSFQSAEVARTGIVPMPDLTESSLGGHAVLCVGYNDETRTFTVLNSWGDSWGDKGFFHIPYEYLTTNKLSDDFWNIGLVEI